jgi:hypothetical protein
MGALPPQPACTTLLLLVSCSWARHARSPVKLCQINQDLNRQARIPEPSSRQRQQQQQQQQGPKGGAVPTRQLPRRGRGGGVCGGGGGWAEDGNASVQQDVGGQWNSVQCGLQDVHARVADLGGGQGGGARRRCGILEGADLRCSVCSWVLSAAVVLG